LQKSRLAPNYAAAALRTHFLVTLGDGFEHFVAQEKHGQLDPKYFSWSTDELLQDLRAQFSNNKLHSNSAATANSLGYANAAVGTVVEASAHAVLKTPSPLEDSIKALQLQMAELVKIVAAPIAASSPPTPPRRAKFYCWTHGISNNSGHTSDKCRNPDLPDHQEKATIRNKMGGSRVDKSE
jgi:hypothetical protein